MASFTGMTAKESSLLREEVYTAEGQGWRIKRKA